MFRTCILTRFFCIHSRNKFILDLLDIKVKTAAGKIINIEIQVDVKPAMRERIVFYNARMMAEQLGSGDDYNLIKKTISIVI